MKRVRTASLISTIAVLKWELSRTPVISKLIIRNTIKTAGRLIIPPSILWGLTEAPGNIIPTELKISTK